MTCSPCDSVLNPQFQKMSSIKGTIFLFNTWTFFTNRPCMSNLNKRNSKQNQTRATMHNTKGQSVQFNLSIHKCIQTGLVGGMPQPHVICSDCRQAPLPPRRPLGRNRRHHHLRPRHRERRHPQHSRQLVWTNRNRSRTIRRFRAGGVL